MKYIFLIILLFISSKNLYAYDLFETSFYEVKFSSQNIDDDKSKEIKKIKIKSLLKILEKSLNKDNFNEINKDLSIDLVNSFIKNIIIEEEKIINDKYTSKIKINFNKQKIIHYLRERKIPYVEFQPNKFLLIIYEQNEMNNNIFSKKDVYYNYFKNNLNHNNFFKIPNLDINDRFILKKEDLINRDFYKIKNFSQKYDLNNIIIVLVTKTKNLSYYELILISDEEILEKSLKFDKLDFNDFFQIIENETLNLWKNINQIENNLFKTINCNIDYYNMLELKEIRNNLNKVSVIKDIKIKSVSYRNIEYDISYYGNQKIFYKIFDLNNLIINNNDNFCFIKLK